MAKSVSTFVAFFALIGLIVCGTAEAKTIVVDTSGTSGYKTIQAAVAAADSGDTVFVKKGFYSSDPDISLKIPITLLGEKMDATIICNQMNFENIDVEADSCTISGFTITCDNVEFCCGIICYATTPTIMYNIFDDGLGYAKGFRTETSLSKIPGRSTQSTPGFLAVDCRGASSPIIHYNNFHCYGGGAISAGTQNIDAKYNYWEANDTAKIAVQFVDGRSESGLGIVDFTPWLDKPVIGIGEGERRTVQPEFIRLEPNPFRGSTGIFYQINKAGPVLLRVFDCAGRTVRTAVNQRQEPGRFRVIWDGCDDEGKILPAGTYFIGFSQAGRTKIEKAVLLR